MFLRNNANAYQKQEHVYPHYAVVCQVRIGARTKKAKEKNERKETKKRHTIHRKVEHWPARGRRPVDASRVGATSSVERESLTNSAARRRTSSSCLAESAAHGLARFSRSQIHVTPRNLYDSLLASRIRSPFSAAGGGEAPLGGDTNPAVNQPKLYSFIFHLFTKNCNRRFRRFLTFFYYKSMFLKRNYRRWSIRVNLRKQAEERINNSFIRSLSSFICWVIIDVIGLLLVRLFIVLVVDLFVSLFTCLWLTNGI